MVPHAQEKIVKEVSKWEGVTKAPHRFGGTEFRLGRRELGHIHGDYQADIVFPMNVRNQLVSENKAQPHHILPKSGWITFRFKDENDVARAIELFKLSYEIARSNGKDRNELDVVNEPRKAVSSVWVNDFDAQHFLQKMYTKQDNSLISTNTHL